jgi:hypothetical protein
MAMGRRRLERRYTMWIAASAGRIRPRGRRGIASVRPAALHCKDDEAEIASVEQLQVDRAADAVSPAVR